MSDTTTWSHFMRIDGHDVVALLVLDGSNMPFVIMCNISSQVLQQEKPHAQDCWFDTLHRDVTLLEELLYISSSSLDEYNDLSSLKLRLKHAKKQRKSDAWFKYHLMK